MVPVTGGPSSRVARRPRPPRATLHHADVDVDANRIPAPRMPAEHRAWIALGANLGDIASNLRAALMGLAALPGSHVAAVSPWYRTRAVGPQGQPDYINGVVELRTALEPHALLAALQRIEDAAGRTRIVHWGARTLDLDLLLFDSLVLSTNELVVPHAHLTKRNFVVFPLFDIAPSLRLPDGTPLATVRAHLDDSGILGRFTDLEHPDVQTSGSNRTAHCS